jgi:hypothetical protein
MIGAEDPFSELLGERVTIFIALAVVQAGNASG